MKRSAHIVALLGLVAGINAGMAQAADTGFYGYVSVGHAESDRKDQADTALRNSGITAMTSSADDTDTGYKLQLGYQFNRNFAVEGGYVKLGKYNYKAASTAPVVATRDADIDIDGWNIGVVGRLPLTEQFAAFGKLGAVYSETDYSCRGTGIACTNPNRTAQETTAYYGLGLDWNFSRNWFARAEYEVFADVGESLNSTGTTGTTRADVNLASVGIGYKF